MLGAACADSSRQDLTVIVQIWQPMFTSTVPCGTMVTWCQKSWLDSVWAVWVRCCFSAVFQSGSQRDYWGLPCGGQCWRTGQRPLEWDAGIPTQAHCTLASISGGKEVFQRGVWHYSFLLMNALCMSELVQGFQRASTLTGFSDKS